jgi:hypothetical protein
MNYKGNIRLLLMIVVFFLMPICATASGKPTSGELIAITERGRLLAQYDAAAWRATDAVLATYPKTDPSGRYIAHETGAGWLVDFGRLNSTSGKFLVDYEAVQTGSPARFVVKSFNPAREDTGWNLAAAQGIETATADFGETDRPYNIAVLPAEHGSMYIYLYPAQVEVGVYPLGADVRYRISSDGRKVIEKRQMHKSIIETALANSAETVAGGYHVHVLSDLPEDTDVMFVLTRKPSVPEMVLAGAYVYAIDVHGAISVTDRPR